MYFGCFNERFGGCGSVYSIHKRFGIELYLHTSYSGGF